MKIILHILRKDLRRHRWEILVFVASVIGWGWQLTHRSGWIQTNVSALFPILMFLAWFLLVTRVVQGESLVGDQEFWTTRPYHWLKLLLAKVLFVLVCLNLPFLLMQVAILSSSPIPLNADLIPGLIWVQIQFAVVLTLPAFALAAITETIVQFVMAVIGLGLFTTFLTLLPWHHLDPALSGGQGVGMMLDFVILCPALAAIILWQYRFRHPLPARIAFAGVACFVPLTVLLASTSGVRALAYPVVQGDRTLQLRFAQPEQEYTRPEGPGAVTITMPAVPSGVGGDHMMNIEGERFTFLSGNGWQWQSPWTSTMHLISSQTGEIDLSIEVPEDVANQLRKLKPAVQVEVAIADYRLQPKFTVDTAEDRFPVPGIGVCAWTKDRPANKSGFPECLAPLRTPEVLITRFDSTNSHCTPAKGETPIPPGHTATSINWDGSGGLADFDPDPRHGFLNESNFGKWEPLITDPEDPKNTLRASFCRGTPLVFQTGSSDHRGRMTFSLGRLGNERVIEKSDQLLHFTPDSE